jgi:hypothetical protein
VIVLPLTRFFEPSMASARGSRRPPGSSSLMVVAPVVGGLQTGMTGLLGVYL